MSEIDEQIARFKAEGDQAKAAGKEVAGQLWSFYAALCEEGFSEEQAFLLTNTYLTALLEG